VGVFSEHSVVRLPFCHDRACA